MGQTFVGHQFLNNSNIAVGASGFAEEQAEFEGAPVGHNMKAHIEHLEKAMRDAASNLEFEEAGRYRDEIRRLQETELAIADDPLARQSQIDARVEAASKGRISKSEGTVSTLLSKPRAQKKANKKKRRRY